MTGTGGGLFAVIVVLALALPMLLLWVIARLHPLFSIVIGIGLLLVPVVLIATVASGFRGVGELWAGLFMVVFLGGGTVVSLWCGAMGLVFFADGAMRMGRGEVVGPARRRAAIGVVVLLAAVMAAVEVQRIRTAPPAAARARSPVSDDDLRPVRTMNIEESYALAWNRRDGAGALSLAIPAADFAADGARGPTVTETRDGPRRLELSADGKGLTLYRDESFVAEGTLAWLDAHVAPEDSARPRGLWIDTSGGGWSLRGIDCGPETAARHPEITAAGMGCFAPEGMARYIPVAFRLEHVRIHAEEDPATRRCTLTFRFRGRLAQIDDAAPCFGPANFVALREAAALLDRLAAGKAPDAAARLARAAQAVARCEAEASTCLYAARLATSELRSRPAEAVPLALRALEGRGTAGGPGWRRYEDAVLGALEAAGQSQGRDALRAHALRVASIGRDARREEGVASYVSVQQLVANVPRLVPADDPLFDRSYRAMARIPQESEAARLAFVKAWLEKAGSPAAGTDPGFKLRYHLCAERYIVKLERETLAACADELVAAWKARAAAGKPFDAVDGEAGFALTIAAMYTAYAEATRDYSTSAQGIRRAREYVVSRDYLHQKDHVLEQFARLEREIGAKSPSAPRR